MKTPVLFEENDVDSRAQALHWPKQFEDVLVHKCNVADHAGKAVELDLTSKEALNGALGGQISRVGLTFLSSHMSRTMTQRGSVITIHPYSASVEVAEDAVAA